MDAATLVAAIRGSWSRPLGLAFSWLLSLTIALSIAAVLPQNLLHLPAVLFLGIGFALTVAWVLHRRLKKCPTGKVGFLVAIAVDDDDTYKIFQRDFIQNIERLLLESGLKERVWVSELPQWRLDRQLNLEEAVSLREATGCTFILYGQVRTRKADRRHHYIDLSGLVGHAKTEEHNTNRLRGEFSELLPRRIIAEEGSELPTFEFNSALSSLVAKYIAGIAAYLSGALDAAEALYKDAGRLALPLATSHEVSQKILERLPIRNSEIVITRARGAYQKWCDTRTDIDLIEMGRILSTAPEQAHHLTEWRTLQAINLVATAGADLDQIEALVKNDPDADPVKHLNLAFFDIARGDLRAASRHYRNAEQREVKLESLTEVISFLDWFKDFRPELRCEVDFALGFIFCHLLRDGELANSAFEEFERARVGRYQVESDLAKKWLVQL